MKMAAPVGRKRSDHLSKNEGDNHLLARVLNYQDGKIDEAYESYYDNGTPQALLNYQNGVLDGRKALWDEEGRLLEEAVYNQGNLHGRYFIRKPDGKEVIFHYQNNILNGLHLVYHPLDSLFGKVKAVEANYVNGLLEGEVSEYNEAGTKVVSTFYKNGFLGMELNHLWKRRAHTYFCRFYHVQPKWDGNGILSFRQCSEASFIHRGPKKWRRKNFLRKWRIGSFKHLQRW